MTAPDAPAVLVVRRRWTTPKVIVAIALVFATLLALGLAAVRFGVLAPQVRPLIEARTSGLKVGRFGRLYVKGLSGDVWRDFRIAELTVRDESGVWLEAKNVHLVWSYSEVFRRRFSADLIEADSVRLLRRPTLSPKGKDSDLPLSFEIDRIETPVIFEPAFSRVRGVYGFGASIDVERSGRREGAVAARSVLRPGDRLDAAFEFGAGRPLRVQADAQEALGGALAGALGLPVDRRFSLQVLADGRQEQGTVLAEARSGESLPLRVRGAWSPAGGEAGGRLDLTASTLTRAWADRLGAEARFGVAGRRTKGEVQALDARILTDNLTIRAFGLGRPLERELEPQGLVVTMASPNLRRLLPAAPIGATRLEGRLTGSIPAWRFAGAVTSSDLALGGYRLARVTGPVTLTRARGDIGLTATLTGAGGQGSGYAAALLGGAPQARLNGVRLADGRLALRRLDVVGRGLKVAAAGGRSLLGGLTFKGDADVSNLAAARPGAGGGADISWTAAQAAAGRPWTVTLDARGQRFASGFGELDRLLGPEPRLQAQANLEGRRLSVARASLDGRALQATTAGILAADRTLSFKVDWSAVGPFRAGPVEIAGRAKGAGAVTGPLGTPKLDLVADVETLDVPRLPLRDARIILSFQRRPDGSSGEISVAAQSAYGPATGRSSFRFPAGGVDLSNMAVDAGGLKATGALSLRRSSPSAADLDIALGPGAFLETGSLTGDVRIVDGAGGARATVGLTGAGVRAWGLGVTFRTLRLTADGPLARLPYVARADGASGRGRWSLDGRGVLAEARPGYRLSFDGAGALGARGVRTVETATFRFGGAAQEARLRLAASDGGRIDLDATLRDGAADIRGRAQGLGLGLVNEDLDGRFDATLVLQGRGATLAGTLNARLQDARGLGAPIASGIDGSVDGRLAGNTLTLTGRAANPQGLRADVDLVLPAESSARPFRVAIARQRPMRGRFSAQGEVAPLWDLLIGGERSLSGRVAAEGTLSGTLADPQASGRIAVDGGRFEDGATGLALRDVVLRADFAQTVVNVTEARGSDGQGGEVSGQGRISLLREGVSSFRLDLQEFRLIDNDMATASATGRATIDRGADGNVRLSGQLAIDRADVAADLPTPSGVINLNVVEINRPDSLVEAQPAPMRRGQGWALDVALTAPRRVFLRGRGLDVEFSLDARVRGTTTRPQLSGVAKVVRGDYEFAGKRFEIDTQSLVHLSTQPEQVRLELTATREDPSLTAVVRIRGTAAEPEVTLTSQPVLPNDEVLARVLFGRSASQLSGVEAAQLASSLSALATGGGFDVIGNLRSFAGLDRLALGGGDAGAVTVSGGKYLTDDVYLELTGGGREGPVAQVEWRVRRNLSILSRLGGQSGGRLAIRWRRDY